MYAICVRTVIQYTRMVAKFGNLLRSKSHKSHRFSFDESRQLYIIIVVNRRVTVPDVRSVLAFLFSSLYVSDRVGRV